MTKRIDLKLVGLALLPALGVSISCILVGKAFGLSETVAERVSQILFFPVFLAACHGWRDRVRTVRHVR
jgi:hypothetical protein